MDVEILNLLLKVGGIAGACLFVFLFSLKLITTRITFPKLTREQTTRIIRLLLCFSFIIAVLGIGGWICIEVYKQSISSTTPPISSDRVLSDQSPKSFRLVNIYDTALESAIAARTGLIPSAVASNACTIEFLFSGGLRPSQRAGYALYDGGYVVVNINGSLCRELKELPLRAWPDNPGNPKETLEKAILDDVRRQVLDHRELVVREIGRCINHE